MSDSRDIRLLQQIISSGGFCYNSPELCHLCPIRTRNRSTSCYTCLAIIIKGKGIDIRYISYMEQKVLAAKILLDEIVSEMILD